MENPLQVQELSTSTNCNINIILALNNNNVLGRDNKLVWKCPEDIKYFREKTTDKVVVYGNKTFKALPKKVKESHKHCLVLSKNPKTKLPKNASFLLNLNDISLYHEIWVCGGKEIYNLFWEKCTNVYLSKISDYSLGDTYFFPDFNKFMLESLVVKPNLTFQKWSRK
jgi:dihydrofolate reductase